MKEEWIWAVLDSRGVLRIEFAGFGDKGSKRSWIPTHAFQSLGPELSIARVSASAETERRELLDLKNCRHAFRGTWVYLYLYICIHMFYIN